MFSVSVAFPRRFRGVGFLLVGSALVVFWTWGSLSWHARGMILAAYGLVFLGFGLIEVVRAGRLFKRGAMARGDVVGAKEDTSWDDDGTGSTTYSPVVRFTTADGRTVEFTSAVSYGSEPDIGGNVDVRYLPDDPEQAEIDRVTTLMLPAAVGLLGGLGLLVAGVVVYAEPTVVPAVVDTVGGPETLEPVPTIAAPETSEPVPELRPPPPKVATGRIGDQLTVYDELGDVQLEVTVSRVKFNRGDEFNQPQRGLYLGAYVKAHALAPEQFLVNFYARVRGHLYDQAIASPLAFDPPLGGVLLNKGERAAGWLVFDVPARHGQLVLRNLNEQTVAVWKY